MTNILILEDDKNRIKAFKSKFDIFKISNPNLIFVETASDAIKCLKSTKIDIAFLDHDLGGETYVERVSNTGYEVALYIENMPEEIKPYQIIIHSHNPAGANRMYKCLKNKIKNIIVRPFGQLFN